MRFAKKTDREMLVIELVKFYVAICPAIGFYESINALLLYVL